MNKDTAPQAADKSSRPKKRRISGFYVFLFLFIALMAFNYHQPVETVDCTPEIIASKPNAIMLGAWWCSYCYQAKRYFQNNAISYCEYDMESDPAGIRLYRENGGGAIPVIMIGDQLIRGFNEQHIEYALSRLQE
jgi:glutaredoxin